MLLPEKTKEVFGYDSAGFTKGCHKRVCVSCDYCQIEYDMVFKARVNGQKVVQKDACLSCRHKKIQDVNLAKYGVKNQFSRKEVKEKIVESNLKKYGVEHFTQTYEHKEKTEQTMLDKYGVVNAMESKELREKQKQSIIERYGVDNVSKISEVQEKKKQTNLEKFGSESFLSSEIGKQVCREKIQEKYGVDNVFKNEDIKKQILETNKERYGVEYPMQNKEIQSRSKEACLVKYGVDNPAKSEEVKTRIRETNIERYGVPCVMQNVEILAKAKQTSINSGRIKLYGGRTMRELSEEMDKAYTTFVKHTREHGIDFALSVQSKENSLEALLKASLDRMNIKYEMHKRINGRFTDFLIEDSKLIIEVNGNFWHSDRVLEQKNYHAVKKHAYDTAGYRSLFFREDEVKNKIEIVESIIRNHCKTCQRVFARKCRVGVVTKKDAVDFFNKNHLMGVGSGDSFGLFLGDQLVSCIQTRRLKEKEYEVSRFCNLVNHSIIGGFSKLLNFVENSIEISSLTTFIDLRYGEGNYLDDFGFTKYAAYLSFKWFGDGKIFNRMAYPHNTGYDYGYYKIWDCGQAKWKKVYKLA